MVEARYYVVFDGLCRGIFEKWSDCQEQVNDYDEAKFLKYPTRTEAEQAFEEGLPAFYREIEKKKYRRDVGLTSTAQYPSGASSPSVLGVGTVGSNIRNAVMPYPTGIALCVHVRVDKKTGHYVYVYDWANPVNDKDLFRFTQKCPESKITRNLAEFDALVKGLAILKKYEQQYPIYTESDVAMAWITSGKGIFEVKGVDQLYLEGNVALYNVINGKFKWLYHAKKHNHVFKWHRQHWGESPAKQHLMYVDEEDVAGNADDGYERFEPFPYY